MDDLISRQQAIEVASRECHELRGVFSYIEKGLKALPPIEPKNGRWIENDNGTWSCNRCHSWIPDEQHYYANFCLYCGADMREGEQE